jgi:xylose isomerase
VGAIDLCAHAFLLADKLMSDGKYEAAIANRYADWKKSENAAMLNGSLTLEEIAAAAVANNINPHKSGRRELTENRLQRLLTSELEPSTEPAVAFI